MKQQHELILFAVFILLLMLFGFNHNVKSHKNVKQKVESKNKKYKDTLKFVDTTINFKVSSFIKEVGIKYPDVVYAQALIESSHFTNNHFKEKNNIFGMKEAGQRTTLGVKESDSDFVHFKSIEEAIIDYKLYQLTFIHKIKNKQQYLNRLCTRYCKDYGYEKLILNVIATQNIK